MLPHPTLDKLRELNLRGMLQALQQQAQQPEYAQLSFEERLGLLVDRELCERDNRRLANRLKQANLRQTAVIEDLDFRQPRGLDRSLVLSLATCVWVQRRYNCLITGPTGVGKTYLACALGHKACREGYSVYYVRVGRLLQELGTAKQEGKYARRLAALAKMELLILDDWGVTPLNPEQRRDLLEILDDRYQSRSTLVTAQLPIGQWHEYLGDPTLADAILDRLVHNAYRLSLAGESMRKLQANLPANEETENR